jgi:hypothetical protein
MTIAVVVLAALILAPAAVWATNSFTDVPDDNTFHADIEAIADARVTIGCNPPDNTEYCPNDFVTREQMAAFMNRLGALAAGKTPVVHARAVQGLGFYADVVTVEVDNADENYEECEPAESLLDPNLDYGTFFATFELQSVPEVGDFFTFDVNVTTSDVDPSGNPVDSGFLVCFALLDVDGELPDGTYTLYQMEAHDLGAVSG